MTRGFHVRSEEFIAAMSPRSTLVWPSQRAAVTSRRSWVRWSTPACLIKQISSFGVWHWTIISLMWRWDVRFFFQLLLQWRWINHVRCERGLNAPLVSVSCFRMNWIIRITKWILTRVSTVCIVSQALPRGRNSFPRPFSYNNVQ